MIWSPVLAISVGAAGGALLRWQLGIQLNSLFPTVPPGTLAANLIGGYIIGFAIAYLAQVAKSCARMASLHHHRLLRRIDHFFDVLRRSRNQAAGGAVDLGGRRNRNPRRRLADDDAGWDRDLAVAQIPVRKKP